MIVRSPYEEISVDICLMLSVQTTLYRNFVLENRSQQNEKEFRCPQEMSDLSGVRLLQFTW